jgi:hypothetical protein
MEEGRKERRKEGRMDGKKEGRKEGKWEGRKKGRKEGHGGNGSPPVACARAFTPSGLLVSTSFPFITGYPRRPITTMLATLPSPPPTSPPPPPPPPGF